MASFVPIIILLVLWVGWNIYKRYTGKFGAPFVPLEPDVAMRVINLADVKKDEVFYDLGSGDGRLVIAAALKGAKAYGVEIDPFKVWYSRIWISLLRLNENAKIIQKNLFDIDLSSADVISLFLLQETNNKLQDKLEKELKEGTRIVSVAFDFPKWKPVEIDPRGPVYGPIYLYKR